MVADLRRCAESGADAPHVVLVFPASVEAGKEFFASRWPQAVAIADPERALYAAFGRRRARLTELISPRIVVRGLRALLRGNSVGRPTGDVRMMPGLFLVHDGAIVREHRFRDAGDNPEPCAFAREA
jgi:hypothetical protein